MWLAIIAVLLLSVFGIVAYLVKASTPKAFDTTPVTSEYVNMAYTGNFDSTLTEVSTGDGNGDDYLDVDPEPT